MNEPVLKEDGKIVLDKVLSIWPAIMHKGRRERILRILSMIMASKGIAEAGEDEVTEAVKVIVPKSYDPIFHMWEDMEKFKRLTLDPFEDMEAYNALPIQVRRWDRADSGKPGTPPEHMKVTAFCASPRKNGNTDILIDEALKGVTSTGAKAEKIMLPRVKLGYCIGCRRCKDRPSRSCPSPPRSGRRRT